MKKILILLISVFVSACSTTDYLKLVKVDLGYEFDLLMEFVDADSNGVFDYMHNKLVLKDETPQHEWKTNQIKYKINKDSSELTEQDITKYLRGKSYSAEFLGIVNDSIPPNLSGSIAISNLDDKTKYYCEIIFENDTNVSIVVPSKLEPWFDDPDFASYIKKLEEDLGKKIWEVTDEDWAINISLSDNNDAVNIHFGEVMAKICETVEMFDINGEKVFSIMMQGQNKLIISTLNFKNGSYVVRFTGREPWNKYPDDRVVIISR